jgi:hypothetical protein
MGLSLQTSLSGYGSAFPGTAGTNAGASPQGPRTAAAAGFGTSVGGSGRLDAVTGGVLSVGTLALAALVYIWWSLPR